MIANLDDEDDDIDGGLHEHSGTSTIPTTSSLMCNGYKIPMGDFDRNIRVSYHRNIRTCINTHGHKGCNILADLLMEQLNRRLKTI